jgi:hypothetical protein
MTFSTVSTPWYIAHISILTSLHHILTHSRSHLVASLPQLDLDPRNIADRTFILPPTTEEMASVLGTYPSTHSSVQASRRVEDLFTAVPIDASDEVEAHISMFNPNLNASYDDMLEDTAWLVSERLSSLCQGF